MRNLLFLFGYVILFLLAPKQVAAQSTKPNILFIMADDMGYADSEPYGSTFIKTPNIDRLATEGMKLTDYHSQPICSPTRASLLSGKYPSRFGFRKNCEAESFRGLPETTITLYNVLKSAGYRTYHIGKWHQGHAYSEFLPHNRGIDYFFGAYLIVDATSDPGSWTNPLFRENDGAPVQYDGHAFNIIGRKVEDIIRNNPPEPFFINYWAFAPHGPIDPPAGVASEYPDTEEGKYAAMVTSLDKNIGRVLDALDETGLAQNTIVIFTSDNGPVLRHRPLLPNGNLKNDKGSVYEGGIRVPFIVRWPGKTPAGSVSSLIASSVDILPTIASIIGTTPPPGMDGNDISQGFINPSFSLNRTIFWENNAEPNYTWALRQGDWKLLYEQPNLYLYNLAQDIGERSNLATTNSSKVQELLSLYKSIRKDTSSISLSEIQAPHVLRQDAPVLFDSNTDALQIPHHTLINPNNFEFSISTWLQPSAGHSDNQHIFSKSNSWRLIFSPSDMRVRFRYVDTAGVAHNLNSTTPLSFDAWTHVAVTLNPRNGNIRLYINGTIEAEEVLDAVQSDHEPLYVGNNSSGSLPYYGYMQNVQFFTASLLPDEVQDLASEQPQTDITPTPRDCHGDINGDSIIDLTDYSLLVTDFFSTSPAHPASDINTDGIVDLTDYSLLASRFLQTCN